MKIVASAVIFAALLFPQQSLAAKCKVVAGVFHIWNGYPPSLRLKDPKSGVVYGSYEEAPLPKGMRHKVIANGHVAGQFCLEVVGRTTVPTQKGSIIMVHVVSYRPDHGVHNNSSKRTR
jgi:hypothetical protein